MASSHATLRIHSTSRAAEGEILRAVTRFSPPCHHDANVPPKPPRSTRSCDRPSHSQPTPLHDQSRRATCRNRSRVPLLCPRPQARTPSSTLPPYSASSTLLPRPRVPSTLPGPRRSPCTPTYRPKSTQMRTIFEHTRQVGQGGVACERGGRRRGVGGARRASRHGWRVVNVASIQRHPSLRVRGTVDAVT